ncbi:isopentenyl-diphosphate Delta-isomerase [Rhodococcus aerolatus]
MTTTGPDELVVLVDEDGTALGTTPKATVHHRDTPLHLAFSCYVVDSRGRVLVTRRASVKQTWPGVRTNTCCGHPAPDEPLPEAVRRRLRDELGLAVGPVELVLPRFRYRAVMADGTVENELCPVYRTVLDEPGAPGDDDGAGAADRARVGDPNPAEVDDVWWETWSEFTAEVASDPLSPWAADQVAALAPLGPDPLAWPLGDPEQLPPAALP